MSRNKSPMRGCSPLLFEDLRIKGRLHYIKPFVKGVYSLAPKCVHESLCDLPLSDGEYLVSFPEVGNEIGRYLLSGKLFNGYPVADCLNF